MDPVEATDSCAFVADNPWDSDATQIYEASAVEKALWEQNLDEEQTGESKQTLDEERSDGENPKKKQKVHGGARRVDLQNKNPVIKNTDFRIQKKLLGAQNQPKTV